jgi:hypothetical protein
MEDNMHPLLAASLINSFSSERAAAGKSRRAAKAAAKTSPGDDDSGPGEVVIRRARAGDASALVRLAALDSNPHAGRVLAAAADEGAVLVAEVDGDLRAAVVVDDSVGVANPFRASAPHMQLLSLRARQLGDAAPRRERRRRRVLSPRTS